MLHMLVSIFSKTDKLLLDDANSTSVNYRFSMIFACNGYICLELGDTAINLQGLQNLSSRCQRKTDNFVEELRCTTVHRHAYKQ